MYDVFYVIARKGKCSVVDIVDALRKSKEDYRAIHNLVVSLEKEGFVERKNGEVLIVQKEKTQQLYNLIHFCVRNGLAYNFIFRESTLFFLEQASKKENFISKDIDLNPRTFQLCIDTLAKYGFVLVVSRRPWRGKVLDHRFLVKLLAYFKKDNKFYKTKRGDVSEAIEKELKILLRARELHSAMFQKLDEKAEVKFIHRSLSLEGNPITFSDTENILAGQSISKYKIEHVEEVLNYKRAVDNMLESAQVKVPLTLDLILKYHGVAMAQIHGAGVFREHDVRIKGNPKFKTASWRELYKKITKLMELYDEFEAENKKSVKRIISFAAFFHNEFQRIHPFVDGNSRTSRLLMVHILRMNGIPVLDFPLGYFDQYMDLTKRSKSRDDLAFEYLIQELILMDLRRLNEGV